MKSTQGTTFRRVTAAVSASLFILAASLGLLVSAKWFLLLIPAMFLSITSLPHLHAARAERSTRLGQTGVILLFNGIVLIVAVFIVGFVRDFLQVHPDTLDERVALIFTTVHIMLGLGLILLDFRHTSRARATAS